MKKALLIALLLLAATMTVEAKRSAPKDVAPLTRDGIVYSAPHDQMGCVQAKSEKTGHLFWLKQIYVVKYDVELEKDVQDCFITGLRFDGGNLIVTNEADGEFQLDLNALSVKTLRGSELLDRTRGKYK